MVIYGVALLSIRLLAGLVGGQCIGWSFGIEANLGGVGIAMLTLVALTGLLQGRGLLAFESKQGIQFWSAMYIPIVVAVAATQDVRSAIGGGPLAIAAGLTATACCFALVPLLSRLARQPMETHALDARANPEE